MEETSREEHWTCNNLFSIIYWVQRQLKKKRTYGVRGDLQEVRDFKYISLRILFLWLTQKCIFFEETLKRKLPTCPYPEITIVCFYEFHECFLFVAVFYMEPSSQTSSPGCFSFILQGLILNGSCLKKVFKGPDYFRSSWEYAPV